MKKAVSKKKIWLIVGGVLLIVIAFLLWWYGVFSDIGKKEYSNPEDDDNPRTELQLLTAKWGEDMANWPKDPTDEEMMDYYKEFLSGITTESLVDIILEPDFGYYYTLYVWGKLTYYVVTDGTDGTYDTFSSLLFKELSRRNNAGMVLLKRYQEMPVLYTENGKVRSNVFYLGTLEVLLAQMEYRIHTPPWCSVKKILEEKQEEKFSWLGTEEAKNFPEEEGGEEGLAVIFRYNFLYSDAYVGDYEWDEEKLNEHASKYIDLKEWGFTE